MINETEIQTQSVALIEEAKRLLVIASQDDFNIANEYMQRNKAYQKRIENYFEPEIEAANKTHKGLCSKKKAALAPHVENYKAVSAAASSWLLDQERKRRSEQARLEEEARLKSEADKAAIISESALAEAIGDFDAASDFLDQIQDVQTAPVKAAPELIKTVKTMVGSSNWQPDIEVEVQITPEFLRCVADGYFPMDCIEVKTGPLKKYFQSRDITVYKQYGITVTPGFRPTQRV